MQPPTMADIAKQVGASRASVSFVLNGLARQKGISRQLERRVRRTAEELGYRPSLLARSLTTRRTMTIGLLLPNMAVTYSPPLAEALEREALGHDYQVILCHHGDDPKRFRQVLDMMLGRRVDGLVVVPLVGMRGTAAHDDLLGSGIPTVLIERDMGDERMHLVVSDVALAVKQSVEHLLQLGHRRIGLLDAPLELLESKQREQAFRQVIEQAGLAYDPRFVVSGEQDEDMEATTEARALKMLAMRPRLTAMVVVNAERAVGLYHACRRQGLNIPADLSVVVVTGSRFSDFHRVRFTSARLGYDRVGRAAFGILLHEMNSETGGPRRVLTAPQWEPGESTAPPPAES